jgi:hypothetical protein
MSPEELGKLANAVEVHISPAFRAQLLEADLALANALREMVEVERAKAGLDLQPSKLELVPYEKTHPDQPDVIGGGRIGGHLYRVYGWIRNRKMQLRFYPNEKRGGSV